MDNVVFFFFFLSMEMKTAFKYETKKKKSQTVFCDNKKNTGEVFGFACLFLNFFAFFFSLLKYCAGIRGKANTSWMLKGQ